MWFSKERKPSKALPEDIAAMDEDECVEALVEQARRLNSLRSRAKQLDLSVYIDTGLFDTDRGITVRVTREFE